MGMLLGCRFTPKFHTERGRSQAIFRSRFDHCRARHLLMLSLLSGFCPIFIRTPYRFYPASIDGTDPTVSKILRIGEFQTGIPGRHLNLQMANRFARRHARTIPPPNRYRGPRHRIHSNDPGKPAVFGSRLERRPDAASANSPAPPRLAGV